MVQFLVNMSNCQNLSAQFSSTPCFVDISIATVDLLQEMTDVDTLNESEEGTNVLIDALVSALKIYIHFIYFLLFKENI